MGRQFRGVVIRGDTGVTSARSAQTKVGYALPRVSVIALSASFRGSSGRLRCCEEDDTSSKDDVIILDAAAVCARERNTIRGGECERAEASPIRILNVCPGLYLTKKSSGLLSKC